ncbi:hypothetical protein SAMN04487934_10688 [Eubacterium ruminantium]|nr:hypothetical protein SAMN04487934_10688 [Eubacterium ruminantium]
MIRFRKDGDNYDMYFKDDENEQTEEQTEYDNEIYNGKIIHKINLANADVVAVITLCMIPRNVVQLERDFATTNTRKTALFLLCFPERGMHNG